VRIIVLPRGNTCTIFDERKIYGRGTVRKAFENRLLHGPKPHDIRYLFHKVHVIYTYIFINIKKGKKKDTEILKKKKLKHTRRKHARRTNDIIRCTRFANDRIYSGGARTYNIIYI
jgi:hypothetical protein